MIVKLINKYRKYLEEQEKLNTCQIHNEEKDSFWGCLTCLRQKENELKEKKRQERIQEIKEAIILALKETKSNFGVDLTNEKTL